MGKLRAAVGAALFISGLVILGLAGPGVAQDVTLTSHDRTVQVSGTLLGYDGEFYRVDTIYGKLTLDGSGVDCSGPGCPDPGAYVARFTLSGARAMGDVLLPALVESFARAQGFALRRILRSDDDFSYVLASADDGRELAHITFRLGTTGQGFADLMADRADMVMATREISPQEARRARDAGLGDLSAARRARIVGLDALVAVVAPGNPVRRLSLGQLARIMGGQITNWQALGGPDAEIVRHMPGPDTGLTQAFMRRAMAPRGLKFAPGVLWHDSTADLVDAVGRDPYAIGITTYSQTGSAKTMPLAGSCGFRFRPSALGLKSEDYPLVTPLFLYTPVRRLPKIARDFLGYLRSGEAQRVVSRAGFVDQRPVAISLDAQGARLANAITAAGQDTTLADLQAMVKTLQSARRLSVTFRFQAGSSRLDAQSRANVAELAHLIEAGAYRGRRLIFVGFSDGNGRAKANRRISARRAQTARAAVLKAAASADLSRFAIDTAAFGEALPMACDDTVWGRRINRRVEVWLR